MAVLGASRAGTGNDLVVNRRFLTPIPEGSGSEIGMPVEIERKFLVVGNDWRRQARGERFCQGYLARADGVTVRVRRAGDTAFIAIKGPSNGLARQEFEYHIPLEDADSMLQHLCERPLIEKTRYEVLHAGHIWHIDEFHGRNAGLVIAEVELDSPMETIELPAWIGAEVTDDERYRNSRLVDQPLGSKALWLREE